MSNGVLDTTKVIEMANEGTLVPVTCRNLTLREKDQAYVRVEEIVKARKRKEALAIAALMDPRERNKFLAECASTIKATTEEVVQESQTVQQVAATLDVTCTPRLNWVAMMETDAIEQILKAYYWSLSIDIPDVEVPPSPVSSEKSEAQGDFFPQA